MLDTDVIAAAVLGEPGTGEEATHLLAGNWDFAAPSHWKAEFLNVIWKAVRFRRMSADDLDEVLARAGSLPVESFDVGELWRGALARAVAADHPAYDTLFVELAARLETKVASFDVALRRKFPQLVKSPAAFLVA